MVIAMEISNLLAVNNTSGKRASLWRNIVTLVLLFDKRILYTIAFGNDADQIDNEDNIVFVQSRQLRS